MHVPLSEIFSAPLSGSAPTGEPVADLDKVMRVIGPTQTQGPLGVPMHQASADTKKHSYELHGTSGGWELVRVVKAITQGNRIVRQDILSDTFSTLEEAVDEMDKHMAELKRGNIFERAWRVLNDRAVVQSDHDYQSENVVSLPAVKRALRQRCLAPAPTV